MVGRQQELAEVGRRLDEHRLVTIVGPGGIGKTALARAVGEAYGETFELGTLYVDLTQVDSAESVGRALAAQMGFPSLTALLTSPGDQPALVVIDNCEHVLDAAAEVVAALLASCASPSVVATSRSPLDLPGESLVVLGPLPLPERGGDESTSPAVRLFLARAADAGAPVGDGALESVADLCRALDGVPLAIELAAARTRVLSPAQVLGGLDDLGVLDRTGRRGRDRHASLRGTIAWSYEQLPPDVQRFFERTAVLAGRFTLSTAHVLQPEEGKPEDATLRHLEHLVDASLVVTEEVEGTTWFRLLHPIRRFARERLEARGEGDEARHLFVRHMVRAALDIARTARHGWEGEMLGSLLAQSDELVAALDHALDLGDRDDAFVLLAVLWGIVHQAPVADVRASGEEVLCRWPDEHIPGWADAAATVASCRHVAGDPEGAIALAERALPVAGGSVLAACTLQRVLGHARRALGDLKGAVRAFEAGEMAAAERGVEPYRLELAMLRAATLTDLGRVEEARRLAIEGQREAVALGSHVNDLWARVVEGFALLQTEPRRAREVFESVRRDEAEHRWPGGEVAAVQGVASAQLLEGDVGGAAATLAELLELLAERGAQSELRSVLHLAGAVLLARGRPVEAADLAATGATLPHVSSFVQTTEALFPVPADEGHVLSSSAALRLALRLVRAEQSAAPRPPEGSEAPSLRRAGELWAIRFGGQTVHLRATKGLDDLARLLAEPEREVHVLDLFGAGVEEASTGAVLDATARRALEDRIRELQAELEEADAANDVARSEKLAVELDQVVDHLAAALGLGGRGRTGAGTAERARQAVTRRLRATIRRIGEEHEALGRHLEASIRTGAFCAYRPEVPTRWDVSSAGAPAS
jgi:predicted ATPase